MRVDHNSINIFYRLHRNNCHVEMPVIREPDKPYFKQISTPDDIINRYGLVILF